MDDQLWDKIQMFIDVNQIEMVVHLIIDYMQTKLSDKQIEQLGDLRGSLIGMFSGSKKSDVPAKTLINGFIDLIERGAIVGVDKSS
ncbi:MAG: hypothetical protein WCJ72_05955 [Chryseobacterium sp.]